MREEDFGRRDAKEEEEWGDEGGSEEGEDDDRGPRPAEHHHWTANTTADATVITGDHCARSASGEGSPNSPTAKAAEDENEKKEIAILLSIFAPILLVFFEFGSLSHSYTPLY